MKKPIPSTNIQSIQSLIPPADSYTDELNISHDYIYFADCDLHPFDDRANEFSMVNAWWLADAALLAYGELDFVQNDFQAAGLTNVELFDGQSTQCYVAHNETMAIVAFRGTQVYKPGSSQDLLSALRQIVADICIDAEFGLVEWKRGGAVRQGWKHALAEVYDDLMVHLDLLQTANPQRTIWFTGHSLGGAIATLAADRYRHAKGLYTFGVPAVGDRDFARNFDVPAYRFINNNDIIARIPQVGVYKSENPILPSLVPAIYEFIGDIKYIGSDGLLIDRPDLVHQLMDGLQGSFQQLLTSIGRLSEKSILAIPVDHLTDHAPIYYSIEIWNNYDRSEQP